MTPLHRTQTTVYWTISSPVGELLLAGDGERLQRLHFNDPARPARVGDDWERAAEPFAELLRAARRVLRRRAPRVRRAARPRRRHGVRAPRLGRAARDPLRRDARPTASSPRAIGHPGHARAVGAANGRNPIAIVIPCHRVIGANGKLTGYAGGLGRKRLLLDLEAPLAQLDLSSPSVR